MTTVPAARAWLRRMAAAAPAAWHYDRVFRWSAIGAGIALVLFVLRLAESPAPHTQVSAPASSAPAIPGPSRGAATAGSPFAPPVAIIEGRAIGQVSALPADSDQFLQNQLQPWLIRGSRGPRPAGSEIHSLDRSILLDSGWSSPVLAYHNARKSHCSYNKYNNILYYSKNYV